MPGASSSDAGSRRDAGCSAAATSAAEYRLLEQLRNWRSPIQPRGHDAPDSNALPNGKPQTSYIVAASFFTSRLPSSGRCDSAAAASTGLIAEPTFTGLSSPLPPPPHGGPYSATPSTSPVFADASTMVAKARSPACTCPPLRPAPDDARDLPCPAKSSSSACSSRVGGSLG